MIIRLFLLCFLDAPSHLFKRVCPSVRRSVGPSVPRYFQTPARRIWCRVSGLVLFWTVVQSTIVYVQEIKEAKKKVLEVITSGFPLSKPEILMTNKKYFNLSKKRKGKKKREERKTSEDSSVKLKERRFIYKRGRLPAFYVSFAKQKHLHC